MNNEKLIEEARRAHRQTPGSDDDKMRAALAVFEKALGEATVTPTDDEREALAFVIEQGWGNPTWDGKTLRPIDRQIADAVLAAGFRRSEARHD